MDSIERSGARVCDRGTPRSQTRRRAGWRPVLAWAAVVALCAPWVNIPQDQADGAGMLAHLHSIFVDGDLLYDNEYARLSMSPLFAFVTGEGVVSNHWPAGATWLQLPGYALGLVAARTLAALGLGSGSALGLVPLLAVRAWACLVLAGIAGQLSRSFARVSAGAAGSTVHTHEDRWTGRILALAFVAGTPLLYYAAEAPLRPHLWGAACMFGVVGMWHRRDLAADTPRLRTLILALLTGLAATVRPQLAPMALLVVHDLWPRQGRARHLGVAALGLALWPMLHVRLQLWLYGADVSDYAGTVTHHLRHFAWSPHHGALSWCPVLAVAVFALGRSTWRRERGSWLLAALLAHQVWVDAGMRPIAAESVLGTRTWAGGTGFAARKLVDVLPLLVPSVTSLLVAGRRARWGAAALGLVVVLCVPTVMLHAAAFVQPEATTGTVIASYGALFDRMTAPASWGAWSEAVRARALPVAVPLVLGALVVVPLGIAATRTRGGLAAARPAARSNLVAAALLGAGVTAHLWLSVCQIRSDSALLDAPQRMPRAAEAFNPRHRATVARIPAHHAELRRRLGPDAAPP